MPKKKTAPEPTTEASVTNAIARLYIEGEQAKHATAKARREHVRAIKEAREHVTQSCDALPAKSTGWAAAVRDAWAAVREAMDAEKKLKARAKTAKNEVKLNLDRTRASLKECIESGRGTESGEKGAQVRFAWQSLEEAEAGRKMALHECLAREEELRKALDHETDNARQLSLFGLTPAAPSGDIDELREQARALGIEGVDDMEKADLVFEIAHADQTGEKETDGNENDESEAAAA